MKYFFTPFLVCFLFFTQASVSQSVKNTNGKVIYKKEIAYDKDKDDRLYQQMQRSTQSSLLKMRYILEFNKTQSKFYLEEVMDSDSEKLDRRAVNSLKGKGVYYNNLTDETSYNHTSVTGIGDNLLVLTKRYDFEMTNETKVINGYTCYKAVAEEIVDFTKFGGERVSTNFIEVWFTPEIPISFGPIDAFGLPGLILEFRINDGRYIATEVTFTKDPIDIKLPKNADKLTTDELTQRMVNFIEYGNR